MNLKVLHIYKLLNNIVWSNSLILLYGNVDFIIGIILDLFSSKTMKLYIYEIEIPDGLGLPQLVKG